MYTSDETPEEVIRAWLDTNESVLTHVSRAGITSRLKEQYDSTWMTAWRALTDEYDFKSHQQAPKDAGRNPVRVCPKCDDDISAREFVRHLQDCTE
jgi:hypothetical protein